MNLFRLESFISIKNWMILLFAHSNPCTVEIWVWIWICMSVKKHPTWLIGYECKIETSMRMGVSNSYVHGKSARTKKDKIKKKIEFVCHEMPTELFAQTNSEYIIIFFTSCSTSIGISRTPLFSDELNGLWDRLGDNERSTDDGNRGPTLDPLLVLFAVSGSGLNGISTIGLGDRCACKSLCWGVRNTLCTGHFFDMISGFRDWIRSNRLELNFNHEIECEFLQYVVLNKKTTNKT